VVKDGHHHSKNDDGASFATAEAHTSDAVGCFFMARNAGVSFQGPAQPEDEGNDQTADLKNGIPPAPLPQRHLAGIQFAEHETEAAKRPEKWRPAGSRELE